MADRIVKVILRGDVAGFQASMASASKSAADTANRLTDAADKSSAKWRAGMTTIGDTAGKVGLVAAAGLGATVKAAMDWESAWAGVTKTVNATATTSLPQLEGELRELARTLPASHAEIAGVAEAAGQLGIKADDVASFTKVMVDLGETTNLSADEAATSIARFANVMGTARSDVDRVGSAVVALGNNFETTEAEIMEMGQRLSAAGAIAGLSESDVLGFAAALTSVGVEAEAGGTAMSKTFTTMRDAVIDGGEKLDVFAQTAGMTAQDFTTAWNNDPAKTIDAFVQGLGAMNESGQSTTAVFKSLGLTDQRLMRALLSAAEAGGKLGDALDVSGTAWSENSALVDEANKRYETSAAKAQIAWNNVKDAAIDFGAAALPVVAKVASGVADVAQVLGGLPGPVKTASAALMGITAVFGGGLWFTAKTVSGVASMRKAFEDLGPSGTKAAGALGKVGKAAGVVGGIFAGLAIADAIAKIGDEAVPSLEATTGALIDLASAGASAKIASDFDSLGESIDRLTDKNWAQKFNDDVSGAMGGFLEGGSLREAKAEVEGLDAALANLVATGNADVAAQALENLGAAQGLSASEMKQLQSLLPGYEEALKGVENEAKLAASAEGQHASAMDASASAAQDEAAALEEATDAMREKRSETIRGLNAEINYQASLDDARKALKENGKTLDITTEKGRANKTALLGVASAWNEQSDAAKNAPGAHRSAIKSFVDLAGKMGMSEEKARALARRILELPDKKVNITADTGPAERSIGQILYRLQQLNGYTARTYVQTVYTESGRRFKDVPASGSADGSTVPKTGLGYADRHPYLLADGEEVISNRHGQADRWRPLLKAINAGRLADGGTVGRLAEGGTTAKINPRQAFDWDGGQTAKRIRQEYRAFEKAVGGLGKHFDHLANRAVRVSKAYNKQEKQMQSLREKNEAVRSAAASSFNGDLFGNGVAGLRLQLEADRNDAQNMARALGTANSKGLDGALAAALAGSGDLNTAQQLAGMSRKQIADLERLYSQRAGAQRHLADVAGEVSYGEQMRETNRAMRRLDRTLNQLERRVEAGARKGVGDQARKANQRRKAKR